MQIYYEETVIPDLYVAKIPIGNSTKPSNSSWAQQELVNSKLESEEAKRFHSYWSGNNPMIQ